MKKILIFLQLLSAGLIVGCTGEEKTYNQMGVEEQHIQADSVAISEILNPNGWQVVEDEILITSEDTKKALFRYHLPEWIFIDTVFSRGEGPEDVANISLCKTNNGSVWLLDPRKGDTRKLSLTGGELKIDTILSKNRNAGVSIRLNGSAIFSDRYIIETSRANITMENITNLSPEYLYIRDIKDSMRVTDSLFVYSLTKIEMQNDSKGNIAGISVHIYNTPNIAVYGENIRLIYPHINVVQSFTVDENGRFSPCEFIGEQKTFDQIAQKDWAKVLEENNQTQKVVGATEDYIFISKLIFQKDAKMVKGEQKTVNTPKSLSVIVYNWDMTPVKEFVLNHPAASSVIVDAKHGKIYARNTGEDFENVYIYSYNLK